MDSEEFHQWLLEVMGPIKGEEAWQNFQAFPPQLRENVLGQAKDHLPSAEEIRFIMNNVSISSPDSNYGINTFLVKNLAHQQAAQDAESIVTAQENTAFQTSLRNADLWLDPAVFFDSLVEPTSITTRPGWVDATIDMWITLAEPVAKSTSDALTQVISQRFGNIFSEENSPEILAGPIPVPLPADIKNPKELIHWVASSAFALQIALSCSSCSKTVFSSFDLGITLTTDPSGCMIAQNIEEFAQSLNIPHEEVYSFLALRQKAYARLFNAASWLMPQVVALITKYARGISVDLDAINNSLLDNPNSLEDLAGSVSISNISSAETDEQKEVKAKLEQISALIEGWVDCVIWRAGSPFIPHISQLREMMQRRIATGETAAKAFESLIGLRLRPRLIRESSQIWEKLTQEKGIEERDKCWTHPDSVLNLLPLTVEASSENVSSAPQTKDWDAGLEELLSDKNLIDEINKLNISGSLNSFGSRDSTADTSSADSSDNSDNTHSADDSGDLNKSNGSDNLGTPGSSGTPDNSDKPDSSDNR